RQRRHVPYTVVLIRTLVEENLNNLRTGACKRPLRKYTSRIQKAAGKPPQATLCAPTRGVQALATKAVFSLPSTTYLGLSSRRTRKTSIAIHRTKKKCFPFSRSLRIFPTLNCSPLDNDLVMSQSHSMCFRRKILCHGN